jgi:hypothetical protein
MPRVQSALACKHNDNEHKQNGSKNNDGFKDTVVSQAVVRLKVVRKGNI